MNREEAMVKAGFAPGSDAFCDGWDASQAAMPTGPIPFLQPEFLRWSSDQIHLPPDILRDILTTAERIAANDGLRAIAWHCHNRLFPTQDPSVKTNIWPVPTATFGDLAGLFYAITILSGTPLCQEIHCRLGIPEPIVRDSLCDLEICIRTERAKELGGRCGVTGGLLYWLLLTWRGQLYRLGRLQFLLDKFSGKLRAFRHRGTGAVIALADDGCRFRRDGQFDGAGQVFDKEGAWTATLKDTARQCLGHPISPHGHALQRRVRLRKDTWQQVLAPGDPVLAIHIPAGPPMTTDACGDSLRRALGFFPKYFPQEPFTAFACASWILDPQIPQLLPPTSNLVRFMQEMYVFPWPGGSGEMPWQVTVTADPATGTTPPMTSMQRAYYAHAQRGGRFLAGGCFVMADDFNWGSRRYLTQALPWTWLR